MQLRMQAGARALARKLSLAIGLTLAASQAAHAQNLIVSTTNYIDPNFSVGAVLPNNSTAGGVLATSSSAFCSNSTCSANVWNNAAVDANFGTTASLGLQQIDPITGNVINSVNVTQQAAAQGINLVTSFASKSELALNLTPDGTGVTFMAYNSTVGQLDISNSNTPGVIESGNTDTANATYRGVVQYGVGTGALQYTTTNAYNGNNGRAAILGANGYYYMVGNGGNGSGGTTTTQGTGVQLLTPGQNATAATPGTTQVSSFNVTQLGYTADKPAKDNNFRGETIYNGVLYVTKGSGSNGIDTVYQVGPAGMTSSTTSPTAAAGSISVLPGFNTQLAKTDTAGPHPFGLYFANSTTLYVADEGSGATTDFGASPTTLAGGLQKYSLVNGTWTLDYTLRGTLIGTAYTVNGTGALAGDSLTTYTDGLRNLAGQVNANGTVTLYATTSTIGSVLGDAGADPNKLVEITDTISATAAPTGEDFTTVETAALGQRIGGVALAPTALVPLPGSVWMLMGALGGVSLVARRRVRAA